MLSAVMPVDRWFCARCSSSRSSSGSRRRSGPVLARSRRPLAAPAAAARRSPLAQHRRIPASARPAPAAAQRPLAPAPPDPAQALAPARAADPPWLFIQPGLLGLALAADPAAPAQAPARRPGSRHRHQAPDPARPPAPVQLLAAAPAGSGSRHHHQLPGPARPPAEPCCWACSCFHPGGPDHTVVTEFGSFSVIASCPARRRACLLVGSPLRSSSSSSSSSATIAAAHLQRPRYRCQHPARLARRWSSRRSPRRSVPSAPRLRRSCSACSRSRSSDSVVDPVAVLVAVLILRPRPARRCIGGAAVRSASRRSRRRRAPGHRRGPGSPSRPELLLLLLDLLRRGRCRVVNSCSPAARPGSAGSAARALRGVRRSPSFSARSRSGFVLPRVAHLLQQRRAPAPAAEAVHEPAHRLELPGAPRHSVCWRNLFRVCHHATSLA